MNNWFYSINGTQQGPVPEEEILRLKATSTINDDTILWCEGMAEWLPMRQVDPFRTAPGGDPYAAPAAPLPPQGQPNVTYTRPVPTDGLAIASLVCGVLAILASCMYVGILFGIPAIICGHMSLKKINRGSHMIQGRPLAIAGLVTGYLGSLVSLAIIALLVFALVAGSAAESLQPEMLETL